MGKSVGSSKHSKVKLKKEDEMNGSLWKRSTGYLILAVILMGSLVLAACAKTTPAPAPTPTPTPTPKPAPATINLKYGAYQAEGAITSENAKWWMSEIEKRSGGRIKFTPYWAGSLFKAGEELESVRNRVADAGGIFIGNYSSQLPLSQLGFLVVPFAPASEGLVSSALSKLFETVPEMKKEWDQYNVKRLYNIGSDAYQMAMVKPIKGVGDLKGLKIGTLGKWMAKYPPAAGAVSVNMPSSERVMSLKTGVIDGEVFPATNIHTFGHLEAAPHIVLADLGAAIIGMVGINVNAWNALPSDLQQIVLQVSKEAEQEQDGRYSGALNKAYDAAKAAGGSVFQMSAADKQQWAAAMPNNALDWAKETEALKLPGIALVKAFIKACEEQGYKFPRDWMQGY